MSPSSSAGRARFWRSDGFVGVIAVLAVVVLYQATDVIGTLERRFYDFSSTATARKPSDRIAVIAIDDQSIANTGRWPWPRDVHAELIDKLAAAKAKTIVHTAFFFEPQTDRGVRYLRRIKEALGDPAGNAAIERAEKVIAEAEQALDTDAKLGAAMQRAGNVLTPSLFSLGEPLGKPHKPLSPALLKDAREDRDAFSLASVSALQPIDSIADALRAVLATLPDAAVPAALGTTPPAGSDTEPTVAFRAAAGAPPVMAAGNAFVSPAAAPGYDATQKDEQAPAAPFDKTTVMNKSGDPEGHRAGAGDTGQDPPPGEL